MKTDKSWELRPGNPASEAAEARDFLTSRVESESTARYKNIQKATEAKIKDSRHDS